MSLARIAQDPRVVRVLKDLSDVVRINFFITDAKGTPLAVPRPYHGWDLLAASWDTGILAKFCPEPPYLKYEDAFQTATFAVPLNVAGGGYIMAGPVILSRKLDDAEYEAIAQAQNMPPAKALKALEDMRTVSFTAVRQILDLVAGIGAMIAPAEDFFGTMLDAALNIAHAECGSIMTPGGAPGELTIRASRGLEGAHAPGATVSIKEGIAGLAFTENTGFVLGSGTSDSRVRPFLKRPDIKHAIVMPLSSGKDRVVGVLSVSTRAENSAFAAGSSAIFQQLSHFALAF